MTSLLQYAKVNLGFDRINLAEHGDLIAALQDLKFGETQQIKLFLLPRNTYKTTVGSVAFPMWKLDEDPNLRILIDSETFSLSKSILSEIKEHYTSPTSPLAKTPCSLSKKKTHSFPRWASDSIILPSRTIPKKEGSINAAGIDGVKAGMHYDIIIADDLHSQHNTKNVFQINQVIEHYRLLLNILDPKGILIVIGTRWEEEDAYKTIAEDADEKIFIPATSLLPMNIGSKKIKTKKEQLVYDNFGGGTAQVKEFYLNFPKACPIKHLIKQERRQGVYIFCAQYLLSPTSSRKKKFRDEWILYYNSVPKGCRRFGIVDPAFTTDEENDFSGFVIAAVDSERNMYIEFNNEVKLEPFELINYLFELSDIHGVDEWYIEEEAAQKILKFFLEYLAEKEDKFLDFYGVKSLGRKKEVRILGTQPYMAAGKVYFKPPAKDEEGRNVDCPLISQIKRYPRLKHDDVIDAFAYLPQIVYDGEMPPPIPRKPPEGVTLQSLFDDFQKKEGLLRSWDTKIDDGEVYYVPKKRTEKEN